jgi:hypothetical protein
LSLLGFLNCLLRLHQSLAMKTMVIQNQRKMKGGERARRKEGKGETTDGPVARCPRLLFVSQNKIL